MSVPYSSLRNSARHTQLTNSPYWFQFTSYTQLKSVTLNLCTLRSFCLLRPGSLSSSLRFLRRFGRLRLLGRLGLGGLRLGGRLGFLSGLRFLRLSRGRRGHLLRLRRLLGRLGSLRLLGGLRFGGGGGFLAEFEAARRAAALAGVLERSVLDAGAQSHLEMLVDGVFVEAELVVRHDVLEHRLARRTTALLSHQPHNKPSTTAST